MIRSLMLAAALAMTPVLFVGCGKSEAEKQVENGNKNIDRLNQIEKELLNDKDEPIVVRPATGREKLGTTLSISMLRSMKPEKLARVEALLKDYVLNASQMLDSVKADGVSWGGSRAEIEGARKNAQDYLAEIESIRKTKK